MYISKQKHKFTYIVVMLTNKIISSNKNNDNKKPYGRDIVIAATIASLLTFWCTWKKKEWWFSTPPPAWELKPNIDISKIKNRHDKNTVPYIASHNISYYWWFENIANSKHMEPLATNNHIVLDDNAWESEKHAEKWKWDPNTYVYLNKAATHMLLDIQNELNEKLLELWYQSLPVYLQVNSASRSHTAQVHLARKERNATNAISAHEVWIAVDISTTKFYYTGADNKKYQINNTTTLQAIYKILTEILTRDCNNKFFITPESSWIIHIVFLIFWPNYNPKEKLQHPQHRKR